VNVLVLLRNRWSVGLMLTQAVLEVFGMICLYFVVFLPLFTHINPQLADVAQIIVIVITVISLLNRGSKLVGLLNYQKASPLKVKNG
jgi:hypothetical protein